MKFLRLLLAAALFPGVLAIVPAAALDQSPAAPPKAVLAELRYAFNPVVDGTEVTHDFIIRNEGSGPLNIPRVKTG